MKEIKSGVSLTCTRLGGVYYDLMCARSRTCSQSFPTPLLRVWSGQQPGRHTPSSLLIRPPVDTHVREKGRGGIHHSASLHRILRERHTQVRPSRNAVESLSRARRRRSAVELYGDAALPEPEDFGSRSVETSCARDICSMGIYSREIAIATGHFFRKP